MLGPLKSKIRESIEEDLADGVRVLNQRVIEHFVIPRIRFATFNHLIKFTGARSSRWYRGIQFRGMRYTDLIKISHWIHRIREHLVNTFAYTQITCV